MSLKEYRRKRRFERTPEPGPNAAVRRRGGRKLRYVVQKHDARRLHYDFRLEMDGVLWSWAVPKGPSLDPAEKRLAVHVEDHPLDYASFEGKIPEGEYGAGDVIVWDRGTWEPDGDPKQGLSSGKLEFALHGKKLGGHWRLVRLRKRNEKEKDNWLLIKRHDEAARPLGEYDVLAEHPESVKSGKRLPADAAADSDGSAAEPAARSARRARPQGKRRSVAAVARRYPLELATLVDRAPQGPQWIHEIKLDGYRMLAIVAGGEAKLLTRNELDWTHRYPAVADALAGLPVKSAVLDGEIVALLPSGISSFQELQNAAKSGTSANLAYYVFDLLEHDGHDLRELPLVERKERLRAIVRKSSGGRVQYSDHFEDDGPRFLAECCRRGLEGIVSKRRDRPYVGGRGTDWLKAKCVGREELVIGGYTRSTARDRSFGALLVGYFDGGKLTYAGRVGTGFGGQTLRELSRRLAPLKQKESPFTEVPSRERRGDVWWVKPELVTQVEFTGWTDAGILRHPSFQGLREDKPASAIGRPESLPGGKSAAAPSKDKPMAKRNRQAAAQTALEASDLPVRLTNPDRILFPEMGVTKLDLARYYAAIKDWILPHLADRPLSLVRCPEGHRKACFFQKHAAAGTPEALRRIEIRERDKIETYLIADDLEGLLSLTQMSVLEIHLWGSRADRLEYPDRLVIDLDPDPSVPWDKVVESAFLVRDMLHQLDLESFVKTTGGKGLHVVVPLSVRRHDWPTAKNFTRAFAQHMAEQNPELYIAKSSKAARKGKIFVDYLRNDRGATAIAPYSTRARHGATVSVPITWDELTPALHSDHFRMHDVVERLQGLKRDPWREFFNVKQQLPKFSEGK